MKILTYANIITFSRFILIIPFLYFLFLKEPNSFNISEFIAKIIALVIFLIASITDFFDGYFARLLNEQSKLGRFLDPLADKFLLLSAMLAFLQLEGGIIPYWMVLVSIFRDFLITTLRISLLMQHKEVEPLMLGKTKTTFQLITIIVILIFLTLKTYYYPSNEYPRYIDLALFLELYFKDHGAFIQHTPYILMLITTIMSIVSGLKYLWKYRYLLLEHKL